MEYILGAEYALHPPRKWSWSDETHLSSVEHRPQAASRVSLAHGNQGRPQNSERPSRTGPQIAKRLTLSDHARPKDMTPLEAPLTGLTSQGVSPPALTVCLIDLKKRADFLRVARARKQSAKSMLVQARQRQAGEATGIRVGFICSKKVGNAVARNRAKRRLRAAARTVLPDMGRDGWDYILIGRAGVKIERPFDALLGDLRYALSRLHGDQD